MPSRCRDAGSGQAQHRDLVNSNKRTTQNKAACTARLNSQGCSQYLVGPDDDGLVSSTRSESGARACLDSV
eukprot:6784945-Pyramimonas_sp.AAC.2